MLNIIIENVMKTLKVYEIDHDIDENIYDDFYCLEFMCKDEREREIVLEFMLKIAGNVQYGENYLQLFTLFTRYQLDIAVKANMWTECH